MSFTSLSEVFVPSAFSTSDVQNRYYPDLRYGSRRIAGFLSLRQADLERGRSAERIDELFADRV